MHIRMPKAVQAFQYGLNGFAQVVSKTNSLEKLLSIAYKAIRLYSQIKNTAEGTFGLTKLSMQVKSSVEILRVVLLVNLMQELMSPNKEGVYFFRRASWQKCVGRIFLLFYSFLSNIKLAAKLELIQIEKINRIAIGRLTIFNFLTEGQYIFYCACTAAEGMRTKSWSRVAASIGKISVAALALVLEGLNAKMSFYAPIVTALSLTIDVFCVTRTRRII